jgi:hypothetical protein
VTELDVVREPLLAVLRRALDGWAEAERDVQVAAWAALTVWPAEELVRLTGVSRSALYRLAAEARPVDGRRVRLRSKGH